MNLRQVAKRWFIKDEQPKEPLTRSERLDALRRANVERRLPQPEAPSPTLDVDYVFKVRQAWEQWQAAQKFFESVADPELVEYAIYDLEAARRRYMYMLKQADRAAT